MTRALLLASLLLGCDVSPLSEIYDSGLDPTDSSVVMIFPYVTSNFDPADVPPAGELIVRGGTCTFDTANLSFAGAGCVSIPTAIFGNDGTAVIASADRMTVDEDGELIVVGNRAALFAVFDEASIAGRTYAGSSGAVPGPGANASGCDRAVEGGSQIGQLASGGGGGGFGTNGATGGATISNEGGRGGASSGNAPLVPLQGGCDGAVGGGGSNGGEAGRGGGAVQISAKNKITVSGSIAAPGGGGGGGTQTGGGGGGGSGGSILLEAMSIEVTGVLTANGGGGGAGGGFESAGGTGAPGAEMTADPALGSDVGGGHGGSGGVEARLPLNGQEGDLGFGGGGGGGGAVGRIRLNGTPPCATDPAAVLSPSATGCE